MIATYNQKKNIVRLLLEHDADPSIKDKFGKMAYERAKDKGMA